VSFHHFSLCHFWKSYACDSIAEFQLVGQANAISELPIGKVNLNPIKFNVPSKLKGLGGLKGSTTINHVDVVGGTSDHINLAIDGMFLRLFASLISEVADLAFYSYYCQPVCSESRDWGFE